MLLEKMTSILGNWVLKSTVGQYVINFMTLFAHWLNAQLGIRELPDGCRPIPSGHMNFDPALAVSFGGKDGVTKAIIYQRFMGWIESNYSRKHNIRDGLAWSYNTYQQWAADIPFLHFKTIQRHVLDLEAMGLLTSKQFDQSDGNPRKYYSSPLRLADGPEQMLLPLESLTPKGGTRCSALNNTEAAIQKPSTLKAKTPTPARAITQFGGVGVFTGHIPDSEMPEKMPEAPEPASARHDRSDMEGVDETRPTQARGANAPSPVPPPPSHPDDTTEDGEKTEPIIPVHAQIFAIADAEVRGWIDTEPERLEAWCSYAAAQSSLYSPGGFVRTGMRIKGHMPPAQKSKFYEVTGHDYVTGDFADFIEH